ncbi:MAG: hypothetical protein V4676_01025 [Bacteroidota bacterium]
MKRTITNVARYAFVKSTSAKKFLKRCFISWSTGCLLLDPGTKGKTGNLNFLLNYPDVFLNRFTCVLVLLNASPDLVDAAGFGAGAGFLGRTAVFFAATDFAGTGSATTLPTVTHWLDIASVKISSLCAKTIVQKKKATTNEMTFFIV